MDFECSSITKVILPAIRASVAQSMTEKHKCRQEEIAKGLGVAQVAVSKYLNGKYSKEVESMKAYIMKKKLEETIVEDIMHKKSAGAVNKDVNELCAIILKSEMKMVN